MNTNTQVQILPVTYQGTEIYSIYLEHSFTSLLEQLESFSLEKRKVCIVTDHHVDDLYGKDFYDSLSKKSPSLLTKFVFQAGESQKNLDTVKDLYSHLIQNQFDRFDLLIALGGGVVGDLTGFTAATYLRGIDFIQVPTTLLSCVDSSIGGKTGVDFEAYKNMVGAFYQPKLVYMNLDTLNTLSEEQFASGMGEILKHSFIKDESYYEWLLDHMEEIQARDPKTIKTMILRSCKIKREIVEKDPKEQGERALLNYGHTIGHAIEKLKNGSLPHGHCIALGGIGAAYISFQRGYLSEEDFYELRDVHVGFDLPISLDGFSVEEIIDITKNDKKMKAGQIRFILLRKVGEGFIDTSVTDEELREAIHFLLVDENEVK